MRIWSKLLAAAAFSGAMAVSAEVLQTNMVDNPKRWGNNDRTTLTVSAGTSTEYKSIKLDYQFADVSQGTAWPQITFWTKKGIELNTDDVYLEFEYFFTPKKGNVGIYAAPKPIGGVKGKVYKAVPGKWTKVVMPLQAMKPSVQLQTVTFVISKRSMSNGDAGTIEFRNVQLVRGKKFVKESTKPKSTLREGVFSTRVIPVTAREKDKRLEIEIPNLLVNGYFREGGDVVPPRGWFAYGGEKYGESYHEGRSIHLPGIANQKTVALRQGGLVLIPGERYRISGYIRGGGFTGSMHGHIGIACDNWSKIRAYWFTEKDIKPDWQYFEVEFTPAVSKAREYETVVYRSGAGGGWIEVDRLILEGVSAKALKESRNKYAADKYDENYAKALKNKTFRTGPPSKDYKLVWSDEFDGDKVDESKWKVYTMDFNGKRDYRLVPQAMKVKDGCIYFTTSKAADGKVEQPRISSTGRKVFTYGYFECRFQLHDCDLANASFWMLPEGRMDYRDPVNKGMEIDIMECIIPSRDTLSQTTHWYSTDPKTGKRHSFSGGTRSRRAPGLNKGFHTVALEWLPDALIFYIDGVESWRLDAKVNHPIPRNPHNIIFSFGGRNKDIMKKESFSTTWKVDYIRVYQKESYK